MKTLPFKDGIIDVIVIDPPHLSCKASINSKQSYMSKAYGSWNKQETISTIYKVNIEFARVLKEGGTIILKILPIDFVRYENLFTNFCFYLPIHTVRQQGCFTNKEAREAALWIVGIKKGGI